MHIFAAIIGSVFAVAGAVYKLSGGNLGLVTGLVAASSICWAAAYFLKPTR